MNKKKPVDTLKDIQERVDRIASEYLRRREYDIEQKRLQNKKNWERWKGNAFGGER